MVRALRLYYRTPPCRNADKRSNDEIRSLLQQSLPVAHPAAGLEQRPLVQPGADRDEAGGLRNEDRDRQQRLPDRDVLGQPAAAPGSAPPRPGSRPPGSPSPVRRSARSSCRSRARSRRTRSPGRCLQGPPFRPAPATGSCTSAAAIWTRFWLPSDSVSSTSPARSISPSRSSRPSTRAPAVSPSSPCSRPKNTRRRTRSAGRHVEADVVEREGVAEPPGQPGHGQRCRDHRSAQPRATGRPLCARGMAHTPTPGSSAPQSRRPQD
jgi:hypothetical protein